MATITFAFDDRSLEPIEKLREQGRLDSHTMLPLTHEAPLMAYIAVLREVVHIRHEEARHLQELERSLVGEEEA